MVVTHATGANATKWYVVLKNVKGAVIDSDAAGHSLVEHLFLNRFVVGKYVYGQRTVPVVDIVQYFIK